MIANSTLDKFYAKAMELVMRYWSGEHRQVVHEINLIGLLWSDGEVHRPRDEECISEFHVLRSGPIRYPGGDADQVVIIDHGEIVERGSHQQLLDKRGFYHHLYVSQFKGEAI